jgi:hypothetical protein
VDEYARSRGSQTLIVAFTTSSPDFLLIALSSQASSQSSSQVKLLPISNASSTSLSRLERSSFVTDGLAGDSVSTQHSKLFSTVIVGEKWMVVEYLEEKVWKEAVQKQRG